MQQDEVVEYLKIVNVLSITLYMISRIAAPGLLHDEMVILL